MLLTKEFWIGALERAIKTFAQTLLALVGTDAVGVLNVDIAQSALAALAAAGISVLTSISTPKTVTTSTEK
jgi:hypothetical protein